jgi:hypothetical protein
MGTQGFIPHLVRWRFDLPAVYSNIVLLDAPYAAMVEELAQQGKNPTADTFEGWNQAACKCFCV